MLRKSPTSMLCAVLIVLTLSAGTPNPTSGQSPPLFVTHVTVVDVIGGRVQPDMTVEIRGRTIAAMSAGRPVRIPRRATVIDGRGKYLIPGLWDMHVHMGFPPGAAQVFLPLMVANGVLGARDMI
jgi:imidazolonepropionase-like amidohydrolase